MGFRQQIFSPTAIVEPDRLEKDQPYSAYLLATNYSVIIYSERKIKLSNEIGLGVMGPIALGEEVQSFVHQIVNSPRPLGWDNQLKNTFLIDYQFRIEKGFGKDWLANHFVPFVGVRIGTLTDRIQIGAMLKVGNKVKYLKIGNNLGEMNKKFIWEWVFGANLQGVFYDAPLEGGLFSNDVNALDKSEIMSRQYQFRTGVNLYYRNLTIRYMLNFNSSHFDTAEYHRFGGVNIGYSF